MKNFIEVTDSNHGKTFLNIKSILKVNPIPENKCRIYFNIKKNPSVNTQFVVKSDGLYHYIDVEESYDFIKEKLL